MLGRLLVSVAPPYLQPTVVSSVPGMPSGPAGGSMPALSQPLVTMHPNLNASFAPMRSSPGMILSPVADPILQTLVQQIAEQSELFIKPQLQSVKSSLR